MTQLAVIIIPGTRGGYAAHTIPQEVLDSLLAKIASVSQPSICVSELADLVVWFETEMAELGGQDAPRIREVDNVPSTASIAGRHAPQPTPQPASPRGLLRAVGDTFTGRQG